MAMANTATTEPAGERKIDATTASPETVRIAQLAAARPDADRVVMVSIDKNGNPAQSLNYHVLVPEGASDEVRDAHHNRAGEALGAKHVTEADQKAYSDSTEFTAEEQAQRAETERKELSRHNFHPGE